MKSEEIKAALIFMAVGMFCGLILGYGFAVTRYHRAIAEEGKVVRSDTIVRYDTTIVRTPQPRDTLVLYTERVKVSVSKDSVPYPVPRYITTELHDTIFERDSIYIDLPITQKVYRDTSYSAWVSGYNPRLDSIEVYRPTTTITNYIKPSNKRWGIGLQVGYGVNPQGKFAPYLGVGISYNILRF